MSPSPCIESWSITAIWTKQYLSSMWNFTLTKYGSCFALSFYCSFISSAVINWGGILQIFRGLAYMHTVPGVCHRDLKPQNVLVCIFSAVNLIEIFIWLFAEVYWLSTGWSYFSPGKYLRFCKLKNASTCNPLFLVFFFLFLFFHLMVVSLFLFLIDRLIYSKFMPVPMELLTDHY